MPNASGPTGKPDDAVNDGADSEAVDSRALAPDADQEPSTALVEVLPGVVMVFGEVPAALKLDLIDFGIVPERDRALLTTNLMSFAGNSATIGGNLVNAIGGAQGLYRVNAATQALLNNGAALAVKDGANLGSMWMNGDLVAQARFIPVTAINAAALAAAIGPAVAMVAMQMQLQQITGLVRTNIALTTQVFTTVRKEQWAELTGHLNAIEGVLNEAREVQSVPSSLWENISGSEGVLQKQLDLYRRHVGGHIGQLDGLGRRQRREYLDTNAEAIIFDSWALLSSLKAWTGYQALRASRARTAGSNDPDEARLVEIIARTTREKFEPALAETTSLVDALSRELHILADLPGPKTLGRTRKDTRLTRSRSAELLTQIEPLADALRPPIGKVEAPELVCAPEGTDLQPYLDALRWIIGRGETLRGIAVGYGRDTAIADRVRKDVLSRIDAEKWATVVAITDRRIFVSGANDLVREAAIDRLFPLDDVRYVRAKSARGELDLITRTTDLHWVFPTEIDAAQVEGLAAVLAESMGIPENERDAFLQTPRPQVEAAATH
ncbi:hypothetical protein [Cellulomonas chengniuliangii]|uniref:Uncharacterized protein n=1 Tax=Cellulomonas chengniuliangii TaxID=2968084 RepID=A0ABY5KY88_9CELL|nr:hypothetical protein [Cellulomonas chengniuliangii]MCC2308845.1 hypothetical protein [Cellulomonas chengniuliangii]UUI74411.1 hypothetical protein NP064_11435 [Cellulomonas chengniuliangii]